MITATIHDLIESELVNAGFDEFMKDGQITFLNKNNSLIQKIMHYDTDVQSIVTESFFQGFTFADEVDLPFKKMFIHRFLNREINRQTLEDFSNKLLYVTLSRQHYIETIFKDLMSYVNNEGKTSNNGHNSNVTIQQNVSGSTQISDARQLESELPQDNINLNVDSTVLDYGNRNSISRNKNQNDSTQNNTNTVTGSNDSETISTVKNLDLLLKSEKIWDDIFNIYDKACFLQTW